MTALGAFEPLTLQLRSGWRCPNLVIG